MVGNMPTGSVRALGKRFGKGFTLVELMVTVAVAGIIAAIAAPSFSKMISHNRLVSSGNEMIAALQVARTEAISRRLPTTVCPSNDGKTCSGAAGSQWIVFSTKDGASTTLRSVAANPKVALKLSPNITGGNTRITFTPSGFVQVGAKSSGTISLCAADLSGQNAVDISAAVVRITSARREAGADCSAPGDI
ncbi:MAG: GspH/FimT family pseudopilin [Stenotrophomonas sp.]|uniref:GspH/FimT family pseudopilin n=1 Tax=Stenotrophomonas sp. TaxID=69392 RepID=UPI003D6D2F3D